MPEPLSSLYATPCPDRAILLGKGPSLTQFNSDDFPGDVIFGINETSEKHRCTHAIYLDPWMNDLKINGAIPIRPFTYAKHYDGRGYKFNPHGSKDVPRRLVGKTAPMALGILGRWGVRQVLMVGFDGFDDNQKVYADHLTLRRPVTDMNLGRINRMIMEAFAQFEMHARWWHRGERFGEPLAPVDRFSWYRENYRGLFKANAHHGYGAECHGRKYIEWMADELAHMEVLVDVGCGHNQFAEGVVKAGRERRKTIRAYGVDVNPDVRVPDGLEFINAPAWNLCLPVKPTAITSFDVLEHLKPPDVEEALAHWASLNPRFTFHTISVVPSALRHQLPSGAPAHLTVQKAAWWTEQFRKHWKNVEVFDVNVLRITVKAWN